MLKNIIAAIIIGGLAWTGIGMAADPTPDFKAETLKHIDEGIAQGQQGHADVLVQHAREAHVQAREALNHSSDPFMEKAAEHINAAISEGGKGQAEAATKHLEAAKEVLVADHVKYENSVK
jgi:hypothetical protein